MSGHRPILLTINYVSDKNYKSNIETGQRHRDISSPVASQPAAKQPAAFVQQSLDIVCFN